MSLPIREIPVLEGVTGRRFPEEILSQCRSFSCDGEEAGDFFCLDNLQDC
ncbi:MAG: hypothetical protein LBT50_05265 [Prevotellaceae bacterium]|jgi:hypothetical protein|nr:hypothetical protein [Prevotellaceae bacterium]